VESLKARVTKRFSIKPGVGYELDWTLSGLPFLPKPGALLDGRARMPFGQVTCNRNPPSSLSAATFRSGRLMPPMGTQVVNSARSTATIHQLNEHISGWRLDTP